MMHDWKAFLQFTEERDRLALKVAELEAENAKYRKIGPTPEFLDGYVKALEAKVKAMMILESADSFQGNVPKGHCLERTSPKGMRFIGTCRMCGRAGLTADQAREECPGRPEHAAEVQS